jgi:pimeloyl-ACP methyl ester carboxylesterase
MEIETTRGRFDVLDEGKGTTTLVLVHGFPLDAESWRADVKALSSRMRVIAPSIRGFGASPAKGMDALTVEGMADDVAAIVATLDLPGPIVIGGLSMGGYVAMAFALKYAEVIRGLILADTKAEADTDEAKANRDAAIAKVNGGDVDGFVAGLLETLVSPDTRAEKPKVVENLKAMMMKAKPSSIASALRALRDRPDATVGLGSVSVPVLVIVGEHDTMTPLASAKAMIAAMPETRTQLAVIPKAAHFTNLEQPEAFQKAISSFIATL